MNWVSLAVSLSILAVNAHVSALESTDEYTLVLSHSQQLTESKERALLVSGIVPFRCELGNQVGTYVVRCGRAQQQDYFSPYIEKLSSLDIEASIELYQDIPILFNFEPITLGEETQAYLNALARKTLNATSQKQAHKPVKSIVTPWDEEQFRQGLYFIDRGWAAYRAREYSLAENLFSLAEKIPKLAQPAQYGKALTLREIGKAQVATELMLQLFDSDYNREDVVPILLTLANEQARHDIISHVLPTLSQQEQAHWQLIVLESELKQLSKSKQPNLTELTQRFSSLIAQCQAFDTWLAILNALPLQQALALIHELSPHCQSDNQPTRIAFAASDLFKQQLDYKQADQFYQQHMALVKSKTQLREINTIRFNSLLTIASSEHITTDDRLIIYLYMSKYWPTNLTLKYATAWHYYNQQNYQNALTIFERIYQLKPQQEAAKGIVLSTLALGDNEGATILAEKFGDRSLYLSSLERVLSEQVIPSQDAFSTALKLLKINPDHPAALSASAWYLLSQHEYKKALIQFTHWHNLIPEVEDPILGQVLALQGLNDEQGLIELVEKYPSQKSRIYSALAVSNFEKANFVTANEYFEKLTQSQSLSSDQLSLYAWSLNKSGDFNKSTDLFLQLLQKGDDKNALTGVLANYQATGNVQAQQALKQHYRDNPVYNEVFIEFGLANDAWLSFATTKPIDSNKATNSFLNVDKPFIWYRAESINKDGDDGTSLLSLLSQQIGGSVSYEQHQVNLVLHNYDLDAGAIAEPIAIGNDYLGPSAFKAADTQENETVALLQYHYQGDTRFTATLAQPPQIDEIKNSIHWSLQWQFDNYYARLFDQPVYDSKLAFMGEVDPYSGEPFGKMHDKGAELSATANLSTNWRSTLLASYSRISGTNTISNKRLNINFSLASSTTIYDNELVYGGFINWQKYQRNSNSYFFGHGGYFSPQSLSVVGAFSRYHQYNQVDWWFIDLSLSYFAYSTDSIEQYPISNRNEQLEASSNNGLGINLAVEKHWLIDEHFEIGLGAQYQVSPGYDFYRLGLNIRYLFSARQNLWPRQHALSQQSLFQSYSPWLELK